jgi:hypothetical protein
MSVFALRPRELGAAPQPRAEATRLSRDDFRRVLIAIGVALLVSLALVVSLLALPGAQQNAPSTAPNIVKPAWIEISKPFHLFALSAPEWGREPTTYTAQRQRDGGGRRDHLTFGTFDSNQPWLHLTLYRMGAEEAGQAPFFVDIARRGAPAGLAVARMGQPKPLATRFGMFQVADFTLDGYSGAAGHGMKCLGFRLAEAKILQIGGFACGAPGRPIDRIRLACTLDRIDLIAAGDDTEMRAFFTGAPTEPGAGCRQMRPDEADARQAEAASGKSTGGFTALR